MGAMTAGIDETKVVEELDEEDELDGWGPVRVRPSSIPARPSATPPLATAGANHAEHAAQHGAGGARNNETKAKQLLS